MGGGRPIALVVMSIALFIGGLNFYLSFVRRLMCKRANGSLEGPHTSGIPVVGSLLVLVATGLGFGSAPCAALGLVVVVLDTGGAPWFLVATWKDASLWDR